jgi:hypothetical protein
LIKYLLLAILVSGCTGNDSGLDALMRVDGAQFFRGQPPDTSDGPAVVSFSFSSSRVAPGLAGKSASGDVSSSATGIALSMTGDVGYWVVQPGANDSQAVGDLIFTVKVSFSPLLADGSHEIVARASDASGHFGSPLSAELMSSSAPAGGATLVVTLNWDTQADLDLHVATPSGAILWAKNINSDANGAATGGILDFDSNSNCQIDGRRREIAYWTVLPPPGHYIARVDTYSLCGQPQASWKLTAALNDLPLGNASGFALPSDTAFAHDANGGVTALEFDIP